MITLTAKINLISGHSGELGVEPRDLLGNNISSNLGTILGFKKQSKNPFVIGASKIGDGSTYESHLDYFMGDQLSDSLGNFVSSYTLTLTSTEPLNSFTIAFDNTNNRHPYYITIDEQRYVDDDSVFTVTGLVESTTHTIVIENWNAPTYPLVITGIFVGIDIDINVRNLLGLNRNIAYRGDYKLPSYGIISNTGSMEFNDLDGEIKDYAEDLILTSDLKVTITLNNTLANKHEQIGVFETEKWDYDNNNRSVSVSLKDDLEEWQDIHIDGINYDPREPFKVIEGGKMSNIYKWLQNSNVTPSKYDMLTFEELDTETQTILENTTIRYPLLESGSLWEQWQKLCEVCGLYIYKNNQGRTVCRYTYGS